VVAHSCAAENRASFAEDLRAFALERLEPYKAPRQVVVLEAMPRTHLGKIDRGRLRKM
jgi:2-aminobenzoate-CoA ligase